ncbi:hypothetical protein PI124_g17477 [Phytophthora idaei]|nr:hypothetical protein PI125_g18053 [Phytophthora idaei]KAG3138810.1 hypothetical protein PI126_g16746 [Phytophthora idaei]KAG3237538.1 hypothetical protein PI124_g17477 [Phytophthora idaei]
MSAEKKRASYSLQFKLNVAREYQASTNGCGFHALSKEHKVTPSMVHDWIKNLDKLQRA